MFLLLLTTCASTCLLHSRNLGPAYSWSPVLTFVTADLRVARVSLRAVAERRVLEHPAVRVAAAVARVHAVPVQARLLLRALAVGLAAHDDGGGCIRKDNVNKQLTT